MKEIPLTRGYVALVDDADYEAISGFKWYADVKTRVDGSKRVYALRGGPKKKGTVRKMIRMHTVICGYSDPDHKDGNGLNNQRDNLRPATREQNMANRQKSGGKSSVFLGVSWKKDSSKWLANIKKDDKPTMLGRFREETDAALAYNLAALELFGEFARFNTPDMRRAI